MVKTELIKRSPLRIFEKSIHGGLGKGNIGIIASRKGIGKTACLVHIATDQLFQDKQVIHVSFSEKVDHIISWYEDIFKEIAKKRSLEDAVEVHDELVKHRVIMNFNQEDIRTEKILSSISAMVTDGQFKADTIIFDGYDLTRAADSDIRKIHDFAAETGVEVWFSVSIKESETTEKIPAVISPFLSDVAVIITLEFIGDHVHFKALKDHEVMQPVDMHLCLDPKTLLIAEEA